MNDNGSLYGRGIAFPPHIGEDGRVAWSEGESNIREAIRIILLTEPGERLRLPEFGAGLKRFLFEPNTVTTRHLIQETISRALYEWEPRIQVQSVEVQADPHDPDAAVATITYRLVATQLLERVSLTVSLAG
jgi:phage baseplate assembly protein W